MKGTLQEIVFLFARARTAEQRIDALRKAAQSQRFDEDQRRELNNLWMEAQQARHTLTPLQNLRPVSDLARHCAHVTTLDSGPAPLLPPASLALIDEWVASWNAAELLRTAHGVPAPGPMLLNGPTGTGKTMLARSLVARLNGRPAVVLDAHRCVDSHMGSTGENLNKVFEACWRADALLVIEELDAFSVTRGNGGDGAAHENTRITVALMRLVETARFPVVLTSNRPDAIDPALLRRLDYRVDFAPLDYEGKCAVLDAVAPDWRERLPPAVFESSITEAIQWMNRFKRRQALAEIGATGARACAS